MNLRYIENDRGKKITDSIRKLSIKIYLISKLRVKHTHTQLIDTKEKPNSIKMVRKVEKKKKCELGKIIHAFLYDEHVGEAL